MHDSEAEEDDDCVSFDDRLLYADALEYAWTRCQLRQIAALRRGIAQARLANDVHT